MQVYLKKKKSYSALQSDLMRITIFTDCYL